MDLEKHPSPFTNSVSHHIWATKYRYRIDGKHMDTTVEDTWHRVASALAAPEPQSTRSFWTQQFQTLLHNFRFLPGGRILAGAGTQHRVTLFNCFVMGVIPDSLEGIFDSLKEGALTLQQGGGVGYDFSTLRPAHSPARNTGNIASGPVSFMRIWDTAAATIQSLGQRRSAMMATLRCDHPDIGTFIHAKHHTNGLEHFNLSVQITDAFMQALDRNEPWSLVFPADAAAAEDNQRSETVLRSWPGRQQPVVCRIYQVLPARQLWNDIAEAAAATGDPGVLFVDRINQENNLWYQESISATNPCGEVPLPAYGACNLGAFNLVEFVTRPFSPAATFDFEALRPMVNDAVRMLDNAIDVSHFPLPAQAERERRTRRIGIGVTGLADAIAMLGHHYDDSNAHDFVIRLFTLLRDEAYLASTQLATERGAFPAFDADMYLKGAFVTRLPPAIRAAIGKHGIRNSHLLAVAPTGTISLLANNVSSGIEPVFDFRMHRKIHDITGDIEYPITDYAVSLWHRLHDDAALPSSFVAAADISPARQLQMQAAIQPLVDNAISKTVSLDEAAGHTEVAALFRDAFRLGLKGCTVFRRNQTRAVIRTGDRQTDK